MNIQETNSTTTSCYPNSSSSTNINPQNLLLYDQSIHHIIQEDDIFSSCLLVHDHHNSHHQQTITTTTDSVYSHKVESGESKMYGMHTTSQSQVERLFPDRPSAHDDNNSRHHHQQNSFLFNLSLLKDKIHQVQSLATMSIIQQPPNESNSMAIIASLIQEIITISSSLMFSCQKIVLDSSKAYQDSGRFNEPSQITKIQEDDQVDHLLQDYSWYHEENYNYNPYNNKHHSTSSKGKVVMKEGNYYDDDIVELDVDDILAKYTHYCKVCGKGFKRDANLRMHMRAHGDEYKSIASLMSSVNRQSKEKMDDDPINNNDGSSMSYKKIIKYSCPQEGCRWNKKHAKFQPLKSMICVKNHYKRSHCPKMYVCKRCNKKKFSVLSDLRTHEKHCGCLKWQCSCGTTFSRKDKLMGHVSLFVVGHTPLIKEKV